MSEPPHPPRVGRRKRRRAPPSPHFWDLRLPESEGPHRSPRVGPMLRFESDLRSDSPKGEGLRSCTVAHGTSRHPRTMKTAQEGVWSWAVAYTSAYSRRRLFSPATGPAFPTVLLGARTLDGRRTVWATRHGRNYEGFEVTGLKPRPSIPW